MGQREQYALPPLQAWVHEDGIAAPLIAHWPAGLKGAGKITHQPGHLIDIMATCLDVAGTPYPSTYQGRPVRLSRVVACCRSSKGQRRVAHPHLCWEHEGNRAVRQGGWKLVAKFRGPWELYNLDSDHTETRDLATSNPAKVRELTAIYDAWALRCGVVLFEKLRRAAGVA